MAEIFLVDIDGYNDTLAAVETLRFSSGEGYDPKDDTIPAYEGRVEDPGNFEQFLYRRGTTIGASNPGGGDILINNNDGGIDDKRDLGYDGRAVIVRKGEDTLDNPDDFATVFTGTIEQVNYQEDLFRYILKNRQGEIAGLPIVEESNRYSGVESPSTHVNGNENIKGKPRPWLLGNGGGGNFSPPLVNDGLQTFEASYRLINSIDEVRTQGALVTAGTGHASLALLQAATPTGGTYDWYLGSGSDGAYFRIGGAIGGRITCKATEGAAAGDRTMAEVCDAILVRQGANFSSASKTALDSDNSAETGIWFGVNENKVGAALDKVLESDNGFWFDPITGGEFEIGRLEVVSGDPVLILEESDLMLREKVKRLDFNDPGRGIPASQISYNYNLNYTIQSEGELAGIALSRTEFVKKKYRTVFSPADAGVLTKHLLAVPFIVNSQFPDSTDAQAASDRIKTIRTATRDLAEIEVDDRFTENLNLNDIVRINYSRYSASGTEDYRVMGKVNEFGVNTVTLFLWK